MLQSAAADGQGIGLFLHGFQQGGNIIGAVLPIGIHRHGIAEPLLASIRQSRLQGRSLSAVFRVGQHLFWTLAASGLVEQGGGAVVAAVVHHKHCVHHAVDIGHDLQ